MIDFGDPPDSWEPSDETRRRLREAPALEPDAHLGGAREEALGEAWLAARERNVADAKRVREELAELRASIQGLASDVRRVSTKVEDLEQRPPQHLYHYTLVAPTFIELGARVLAGTFWAQRFVTATGAEPTALPPAWLASAFLER